MVLELAMKGKTSHKSLNVMSWASRLTFPFADFASLFFSSSTLSLDFRKIVAENEDDLSVLLFAFWHRFQRIVPLMDLT